jgi:hypothetical protein
MPIELQTEYLPPTQSQKPNTSYTPKAEVSFKLVEHAHICLEIISFSEISFIPLISQDLEVRALSIVSEVVKVLELIKNRVSSGLRPSVALAKSIGSTLAKNLRFLS